MQIILTKLRAPRLKPEIIERRFFSRTLTPEEKKAVLITAPAGYGKTTLLLQLLQKSNRPFFWYQLDAHDNDPAVFMQYLIAGFRELIPRFGAEAQAVIAQGNIELNLRLLVSVFTNAVAQFKGEVFGVLDDFQYITEPLLHHFIQELLERLPENFHLLLASRNPFPLKLSRLSAAGEIAVFNVKHLSFNRDEIIEYFMTGHQLNPPEKLIDYLDKRLGGWPIALRLAAVFANDHENGFFTQGQQEIYAYLAGEVLEDQPREIRDFLIATSVLDVMTSEYCDLLLERSDSERVLNHLEKQQLFLTVLSGKTKAYQYHHLFREFLRSRLGDARQESMRRAGIIARDYGECDRAVEYFIAAGNITEAKKTIEVFGKTLLFQGCWQTVLRWLNHLPPACISANPWFALYQAKIEIHRGRLEEADRWVKKTLALFDRNGDQTGLAESRLVQARILRQRGRYRKSIALLEAAESYLATAGPRIDISLEKSILFYLTGRLPEAERLLVDVLSEAERFGADHLNVNLLVGLGDIYYLQGHYQKALKIYEKAKRMTPDSVLPGYNALDFSALIHQDWGEVELAFEYLQRNVAIMENLGMNEALPLAYLHLAFIHVDRGEIETATKCYERAYHLNLENRSDSFYLALNLVFWGRSLALQGYRLEAREKVEEAVREAGKEPSLALANCLAVGGMVMFLIGDLGMAEEMLRRGTAIMERMGFRKGLCYAYEMSAALFFATNQPEPAGKYARKALELAARLNDLQVFLTFHDILRPILKYGLEHGIELSFIHRVLLRLGPAGAGLLIELANHPDPEVRKRIILPLGEFGEDWAGVVIRRLMDDDTEEVGELAQSVAVRLGIHLIRNPNSPIPPPINGPVSLRIEGLGALRIILGGKDITGVNWRTKKARDLLIYLAHSGEPVHKERILEDLWPDEDYEKAVTILHTTIYRLRRVLNKYGSDNPIICNGGRYQLLHSRYETDWRRFERLCSNISASGIDDGRVTDLSEEALSLYRGHYLADMDYCWILPSQEHYKNLYIQISLRLAGLYIDTAEFAKAVHRLNRLTETESLLEEAHILMMKAYIGMGDRVSAIRYYQKTTDLFRDELGLLPPAETVELYHKICM